MLQANSAGRVRLNLIIRIGDSSNLESHKRLSCFCDLMWKITLGFVRKDLGPTLNFNPKEMCKIQPQDIWHVPDMSYIWRYPRWYWDPSFHIWPQANIKKTDIWKFQGFWNPCFCIWLQVIYKSWRKILRYPRHPCFWPGQGSYYKSTSV